MNLKTCGAAAFLALVALPAAAQETPSAEDTYREIEASLGFVPNHLRGYPESAIAGAWAMHEGLTGAKGNELAPKVKSLINLAVAAQIPCEYCVWLETELARAHGATQGEIAEAVDQAGYVRHWSAVMHGLQIDFDAFRVELGGE